MPFRGPGIISATCGAVTGLLDGAGALFRILDPLNRIIDLLEQQKVETE